jgi:hypothetical protein
MKRLIRITCDGPGCTRTLTVEGRERMPVEPAWLTVHRLTVVEGGVPVYAQAPLYDFCSGGCLRAFLNVVPPGEASGGTSP